MNKNERQNVSQPPRPCPHCGGGDIVQGISLSAGVETGPLGLVYKAAGFFNGVERVYADLCRGCGAITRFSVRRSDRNWRVS